MSKVEDVSYIYPVLYVDDKLIAAKKMCDVQKLKVMNSEFEIFWYFEGTSDVDLVYGDKDPSLVIGYSDW